MALASTHAPVETPSHAFYRDVLELLTRTGIPFLIGVLEVVTGGTAAAGVAGAGVETMFAPPTVCPRDVSVKKSKRRATRIIDAPRAEIVS